MARSRHGTRQAKWEHADGKCWSLRLCGAQAPAARLGPACICSGRSSRATPASSHCRGTRGASDERSLPVTTTSGATPSPGRRGGVGGEVGRFGAPSPQDNDWDRCAYAHLILDGSRRCGRSRTDARSPRRACLLSTHSCLGRRREVPVSPTPSIAVEEQRRSREPFDGQFGSADQLTSADANVRERLAEVDDHIRVGVHVNIDVSSSDQDGPERSAPNAASANVRCVPSARVRWEGA
jgi:hypothetical protein